MTPMLANDPSPPVLDQKPDDAKFHQRFWKKLRATLSLIPFSEDVLAAYFCATDRTTPATVKALLLAALAYFILPFDSIPDMLAGLGYTDDFAVLFGAMKAVQAHIKPEHRERAKATLQAEQKQPKI